MKKLILVISLLLLCNFQNVKAQNDGDAVLGIAGGLLAIGSGIAAVEQMKESAELTATQWVLTNLPEMESFSLKTLDFDGKKLKDMSSVSVVSFTIQEFEPDDKPELTGKKHVLLAFTSQGWINEYGINFDKIQWFLIDANEWMNMMIAYVKVSSKEKDDATLQNTLKEGKVVNKGVKIKSKLVVPFYKLSGDMYVVTDYNDKMKLLYNERSLGIFLKETKDLVQMGRGDLIKIHQFFFGDSE